MVFAWKKSKVEAPAAELAIDPELQPKVAEELSKVLAQFDEVVKLDEELPERKREFDESHVAVIREGLQGIVEQQVTEKTDTHPRLDK